VHRIADVSLAAKAWEPRTICLEGTNREGSSMQVVIAGAGPTGLMLAAELLLAEVDVMVVEPRMDQDVESSRGGGLHARTIEVLDQRGIAERFIEAGQTAQVAAFSWIPLDVSDFPTRHPYGLALWQAHFERILAGWAGELGVRIERGRTVSGFTQDDDGIDVALSDGEMLRARYLVGCDGARSLIRKAAGIDFAGWEASTSFLIAEVEMTDDPAWGARRDERGIHAIGPLEEGGARIRVVLSERGVPERGEPTLDDLRESLHFFYGTDFGVHSVSWLSRFTDMTRQAVSYRDRRVLLAGDAAHVHSPMGGQGLNLGVQDAVNLGWKLAQVVHGTSPDNLLDTYQAERHPVGARALRTTMAATALSRSDDRMDALRETVTELLALDQPRRLLAGVISGLDIHYDLGPGHPLLGRRLPDLELASDTGPFRAYSLLHDARPLLLNLGQPGALDTVRRPERVQLVDARCEHGWELPVIGEVPDPDAVLVRPDGHVAWVGAGGRAGLSDALARWCGTP
jgi:3-(3-hydroxy-phenyl)propionate hydroxylase